MVREFDFENCIAALGIMITPFGIGAMSSSNLKSAASRIKKVIASLGKGVPLKQISLNPPSIHFKTKNCGS